MNRNTNTHHAMRIRVLSLLAALMLALGVLPAALAEDGQYGYVNFDNVRFRKQANDTVVWDKLNNGWVCKILGTKSAGGVNYYYVSTNLPAYLDRESITAISASSTSPRYERGRGGRLAEAGRQCHRAWRQHVLFRRQRHGYRQQCDGADQLCPSQ